MSFWYFRKSGATKMAPNAMPGKVEYMRRRCKNYVFKYLKRKDSSDTPEALVGGAAGHNLRNWQTGQTSTGSHKAAGGALVGNGSKARLTKAALVGGVYGFIGIVERFDESMVMLSFLLRIPLSDVLYLKSKESTVKGLIRHPALAEEDPDVRAYAASAGSPNSHHRRKLGPLLERTAGALSGPLS